MISSLLFLGSGASLGVPVIGCGCEVCHSHYPFNKRLRSSVLLKIGDKRLLIDAGPDFREQALRHHIKSLDGAIFTHAHQDHVAGVDDLRVYAYMNHYPLECLMSEETAADLSIRFGFLFKDLEAPNGKQKLSIIRFHGDKGEGVFQGVHFKYFSYEQIGMKVNGYRFGNLAYLTDIRDYNETIFEELQGLDTLVLSALRFTGTHMHFSIEEACAFAKKTGARHIYLTHLSHDLDHFKTSALLPDGVRLAYDGLEIPFIGNSCTTLNN